MPPAEAHGHGARKPQSHPGGAGVIAVQPRQRGSQLACRQRAQVLVGRFHRRIEARVDAFQGIEPRQQRDEFLHERLVVVRREPAVDVARVELQLDFARLQRNRRAFLGLLCVVGAAPISADVRAAVERDRLGLLGGQADVRGRAHGGFVDAPVPIGRGDAALQAVGVPDFLARARSLVRQRRQGRLRRRRNPHVELGRRESRRQRRHRLLSLEPSRPVLRNHQPHVLQRGVVRAERRFRRRLRRWLLLLLLLLLRLCGGAALSERRGDALNGLGGRRGGGRGDPAHKDLLAFLEGLGAAAPLRKDRSLRHALRVADGAVLLAHQP
mmetsp:Transcript_16335/g.49416  ORF Transcript_16335/g.49416 Transcript_16335/m.49416 type:complete len:326 (-) Transcript_16335:473-1450(-)